MENNTYSSRYARSLIEASLDPLVTINTDGKITDMNQATIHITGLNREELTDTDFFHYFTNSQMAKEVYKDIFANGSVSDSPLTIRHIDGKLTDVLFNGSIYKDDAGNVLGVVIVARDVTFQNGIAKELNEAKLFAEQAAKIAEEATKIAEDATRKAETAQKSAEAAVIAKQQFLSNMSHEIRTPMNAIIGFTKVVLNTELTEKQKEYLYAIKDSGDALIVLINDILDLAKVDAGKMTFVHVPFTLSSSINAMIHLFEQKILEKNLEIVKDLDTRIPAVLLGDSVRLHQIILNLLSNAVKFTSQGKIIFSVQLLKEKEEEVEIEFSVEDTGIGISEEKIDHVFENFHQATSDTSRLYGGTGLGLAIVKQLVESQGGTVTVKSVHGKGSVFSFVLTFKKTNSLPEPEIEFVEPVEIVKNICVLVVEDIALNQLLMKTVLEDFGFTTHIAGNGEIALEKMAKIDFDIILMDLQMPVMNGFETTKHIRNILNSNIPIIALTADVTTVDVAKCKEVGMNDYLAKPVNDRLLYSKIINLVKSTKKLKTKEVSILELHENNRFVNLKYLNSKTKSNPIIMLEMINLYLEQTPPLILEMSNSMRQKDWDLLQATIHKLIPSFHIMGVSVDYENMAKKVHEFARVQQQIEEIEELVLKIESVCNQVCVELKEEFNKIKNKQND